MAIALTSNSFVDRRLLLFGLQDYVLTFVGQTPIILDGELDFSAGAIAPAFVYVARRM